MEASIDSDHKEFYHCTICSVRLRLVDSGRGRPKLYIKPKFCTILHIAPNVKEKKGEKKNSKKIIFGETQLKKQKTTLK